jgi:predicted alpha/beta superfamily hydrolase
MSVSSEARIAATRLHTLTSKALQRNYTISVGLPPSYPSGELRYPTVYVLDGNTLFGLATDLSRTMQTAGDIRETIVVGIGYPLRASLRQQSRTWMRLRALDLTPVVDAKAEVELARITGTKRIRTGGAEAFLRFLSEQLIPFVDRKYRTRRSKRVLCGHSLGGLFALYALYTRPRIFSGYVVASPSLFYADRALFKQEEEYSKTHRSLPARLFISVGDREEIPEDPMTSDAVRFTGILRARTHRGFTLRSFVTPDCGHGGIVAPAFQAGLQFVLSE